MSHTGYSKFDYLKNSACVLKVLIVIFWIFGMIAGAFLAHSSVAGFVSLMLGADFQSMSIVGNFSVLILPFIISAIAAYCKLPFLFLPIAFFKALLFSYSGCGIIFTFGSAGWLLRWLLVFSDTCALPVLIIFWLRNAAGDLGTLRRDCIIYTVYALLICCIDCFAVSPFVVSLLNNS